MRIFLVVIAWLLSSLVCANDLNGLVEKGVIEFAVYEKFPPFSYRSDKGKPEGIDFEIGKALAEELGVKARFRLVAADESVEDDLRNYIWKGHFTAGGKSDVMLHVPYDERFIKRVSQISFIMPYYNEGVVFALNQKQLGNALTLEVFTTEKVGVEIETLADIYLLNAFGGRIRENVVHFSTVKEASKALIDGELAAVMASRSELEAGLGNSVSKFKIGNLPTPGLDEKSWDLGMAVKADRKDLSDALNRAMRKLLLNGKIEQIFSVHGVTYVPAMRKAHIESDAELAAK
jgi:ABC-type amino acid transport substrate-binding protein